MKECLISTVAYYLKKNTDTAVLTVSFQFY